MNETLNDADNSLQSHGNWASTFPECMDSVPDSLTFLNRCICIGVSTILYKRGVIPQQCFKGRLIEKYRVYTMNTSNAIGNRLHQKIKGVCDAIRQGYLDEIAVVFFPKLNVEEVFEVYSFKINYDDDNNPNIDFSRGLNATDKQKLMSFKYNGPEQAKGEFFRLVRVIHDLTRKFMRPLPPNCDAGFRSAYRTHTPADYQAPGFVPSDIFYELVPEAQRVEFGHIRGGHHESLVVCYSTLLEEAGKVRGAVENCNKSRMNQFINESFAEISNVSNKSPKNTSKDGYSENSKGRIYPLYARTKNVKAVV
ncbi:unnamed protein product [Caenorhabditis auriculariae]|uniref:HORMA domain-containing protein n=1 Tax=Caenorhabditis auriculariae TaxID=2777116 RepID=A0A8S1HE44_9PELO|nr:unnamed protein product [Caenorhabditis auriculariae]